MRPKDRRVDVIALELEQASCAPHDPGEMLDLEIVDLIGNRGQPHPNSFG